MPRTEHRNGEGNWILRSDWLLIVCLVQTIHTAIETIVDQSQPVERSSERILCTSKIVDRKIGYQVNIK